MSTLHRALEVHGLYAVGLDYTLHYFATQTEALFLFYNKMHFSRSQSSNPPPNESYIAFSLRCPLLKIKKNFMRASMTFNLPPIEAQDYHFS